MIAIIFLIISFLFGWCLLSKILPENLQEDTAKIAMAFIVGIFVSVSITFLLNLFFSFAVSIIIVLYILFLSCFFLVPFKKNKHFVFTLPFSLFDYFLLTTLVILTTLLINQSLHFTFDNFLQIGSNEWGDFDLHLPFIRSFTWGVNMPPQLPFFPNANASYHFMFDYWSAILEFGGMPLTFAFNIASILSFTTFLFCLYKFTNVLFHSKKIIGIFAIVFFLFNSTLEFFEGYSKFHVKNAIDFLQKIIVNHGYLSAGPFTSDHVSIIWNLNVFLNQRHLLFGFALALTILYLLYSLLEKNMKENYFFPLAIFIGLTPAWDVYVFLSLVVIVSILTIFYAKGHYKFLFVIPISILIALPQILWLSHDVRSFVQFNPGFLTPHPLTFQGLFTYWFYNLGISIITIPLGFFLSNKQQKKWFLAIVGIFVLGNLIQFNSVMFNNHKLFNFWLMVSNGYTALVVYTLIKTKFWWKWALCVIIIFLLTFSGTIDMFVIKNETFYTISDYTENTSIQWIANNTPKNAIFLIQNYNMYDPIRMAGRKTFLPFPRFADEFGYNVQKRNILIANMYSSKNIYLVSKLLHENQINYVVLPTKNSTNTHINYSLFRENFPSVYQSSDFDIVAVP